MVIDDLLVSFLVLIGVRFIAFLMFMVLFFKYFKSKYLILSLGWLIYMLGPIPDVISNASLTQSLHPFFGFSAATGTSFLMISVILYYRNISLKIIIPIISLIVLVLGLLILILPEISGMLATISQGLFLIGILFLVIINWILFKADKAKGSYFWLCASLVFGLFHAFGFNLFYISVPLSIKFVLTFLINISFLEYFIYMDWEQSSKNLQESDKRYRFIFNTAPVAMFEENFDGVRSIITNYKKQGIKDPEKFFLEHPEEMKKIPHIFEIHEVNQQTLSLFKAETKEELLKNIDKLFLEDTYKALVKSMLHMLNKGGYSSYETVVQTLDGERRDVLINCYYSDKSNLNKNNIISMVDITEKNAVQKELESSLREKEILIQEVHHRVKNNLSIILSILSLQSRNVDDAKRKDLIQSIENRISTMALVHDQLYTNRDLKSIDIADFIRQLTDELHMNIYNEEKPVRIVLEIKPARFNLNLLFPLGMMINEIVSNSFKHAFDNTADPEIRISLSSDKRNYYILSIKDNGEGFSNESDFKDAESSGFIVINALAKQIEAELSVNMENGTEFRLGLKTRK
ncbi:MAG: sensor histidine kinase [Spirochaetales bacterium]|nr:sensor histidine kinase [Spirochaetales bacterium]